ncbi:MAG TPA: toll/interleukin-1 receptor domain-containing protein [Longimicrobium sp.]
MSTPVFISYNFVSDREYAHNIGVFFQPRGPCQGTPRFVKDVSAGGDRAIDDEIRRAMDGCVAAVFVCGQNSHNSPWINREAQLAISLGLGIVALRAPGALGGIPAELEAVNPPLVPWDSDAFCAALNRVIAQAVAARTG